MEIRYEFEVAREVAPYEHDYEVYYYEVDYDVYMSVLVEVYQEVYNVSKKQAEEDLEDSSLAESFYRNYYSFVDLVLEERCYDDAQEEYKNSKLTPFDLYG